MDKPTYSIQALSVFSDDVTEASLRKYASHCVEKYVNYCLPLDVNKRSHQYINEELGCLVTCSYKDNRVSAVIESLIKYKV